MAGIMPLTICPAVVAGGIATGRMGTHILPHLSSA